ncbi:MAG: hypothetical protein RID93_20970 [Sandaracinaceae bacterium]
MKRLLFLSCAISLCACGGDPGPRDATADTGASDAASPVEDAGLPPRATEPTLPSVTGTCPEFADGRITVSPEGLPPREVRLWIGDAAQTMDGPLVFYRHGAGSRVEEAEYGLGPDTMEAILGAGGMVVAPTRAPDSGDFPWHLTTGNRDDDLRVADEILACAIASVGVDTTHIHSIGMSAGGLHTTQMSYRRSSYLASVVTYSGGLYLGRAPRMDEPTNRFPSLIFHGGPSDIVIIEFEEASLRYHADLTNRAHTAFICDHGAGHSIPTAARDSVWEFFQAHPYGAESPWAEGLPDGFYAPCGLEP